MANIYSAPTCARQHVLKHFPCMILFDSSHHECELLQHDLNFISEKMDVYRFYEFKKGDHVDKVIELRTWGHCLNF